MSRDVDASKVVIKGTVSRNFYTSKVDIKGKLSRDLDVYFFLNPTGLAPGLNCFAKRFVFAEIFDFIVAKMSGVIYLGENAILSKFSILIEGQFDL